MDWADQQKKRYCCKFQILIIKRNLPQTKENFSRFFVQKFILSRQFSIELPTFFILDKGET